MLYRCFKPTLIMSVWLTQIHKIINKLIGLTDRMRKHSMDISLVCPTYQISVTKDCFYKPVIKVLLPGSCETRRGHNLGNNEHSKRVGYTDTISRLESQYCLI